MVDHHLVEPAHQPLVGAENDGVHHAVLACRGAAVRA